LSPEFVEERHKWHGSIRCGKKDDTTRLQPKKSPIHEWMRVLAGNMHISGAIAPFQHGRRKRFR
jgi:hypothetical protein